jgi:uncharacterized SAM-binding protein YcdF (DUF218 family)
MVVFLSKLIPLLIYPIGLAALLIVLALFLQTRIRLQRVALLLALGVLFVGGNRWLAMGLAHALESHYRLPNPPPPADAIVVLGGGTESAEPPRSLPEVNSAGDRLIYAAWLYRQGAAPAILVSGGLVDWSNATTTPADDMATLLDLMSVPAEAIWRQPNSRNTYEDALYSAELLRQKGARRILLVTSAWHMPRAVRLFEAQDLDVIPAPADFMISDNEWNTRWSLDTRAFILALLPSVDNLALTTKMLKEYFGMLYYSLIGWD